MNRKKKEKVTKTRKLNIMSETEMDIQFDMPKNKYNVIKAIGVGGGGSNAINHMFQQGINGVDFAVSNTDAQALENSPVPTKIQLGVNLTEGLGAGANPEIGEQAALESLEDLKSLLDSNTKMLFITAGMGGGTGTGAAPIIAKQAQDMEILTVGIVTIPFKFEGKVRNEQAQIGVEKLRRNVDSLIVINNDKLREVYGNLGFKSGFSKADEVLATASRGIAEVITHHYTQNIDLRDAKTVLKNSGTAIMGSAQATGGNRAQEAIGEALDSPLLNDNKISGSQNVLLLIVSGSEEVTLDEIGEINDHIQGEAGHSANIIMGVGEDEDLGESIAVTIIATGFAPEQQNEISNTESKKIIHTLEDEQKAVQNLSPKNSGTSATPRRRPAQNTQERTPEKPQRIVHSLEEEQEETKQEKQNGLKLVPTSDIIRELEVNYQEVNFDEDDFVFIDAQDNGENPSATPDTADSAQEEPMFEFDMPRRHTTEPSPEQQPAKRENYSNRNRYPEDTPHSRGGEQVKDQVHLFPENTNSQERTKRYDLEDYLQKEEELTNAKPADHEPYLVGEEKPEDRSINTPEPEPQAEENTDKIDPLNSPISEEMAARASERRQRMKKFNYKFRKSNNIDEIEKQPAYKRAGLDLNNNPINSQDNQMSRSTIEGDKDNPHLRANNSFLHDNVD